METFIDKCGKKRAAMFAECRHCKKKFLTRKDQPATYCSADCKGLGRRNRTTVKCANCGAEFDKPVSKLKCSKSHLYFCSRKCKDEAQKIGGIEEIMPFHYGTSNGKHLCKKLLGESTGCYCGCKARFLLNIHHIDGNRDNNVESNLEVVCVKCHAIRHLKMLEGEWKYDPSALTPRDKIEEIRLGWLMG